MKKHIITFYILFSFQITLANPSTIDSLKNELSQHKIELRKIDSLSKDLTFYKIKEDYYSDALNEQTSRFSLIVGSIIALVALISFASFKNQVNSLKNKTSKQLQLFQKEMEQFQMKILKNEHAINSSSVYALSIGGTIYKKQNEHYLAFELYLAASSFQSEALIIAKKLKLGDPEIKRTYKSTIGNLTSCKSVLEEVVKSDENKELILERFETYLEKLLKIAQCTDRDLDNLIAEIRVLLVNYIQ